MTTPPRTTYTADDLLATIPSLDLDDEARVHERLVDAAEHDDLLDVSYRTVDSPVGPLLLAATPAGLVRVAFEREGHDAVLHRLAAQISPRIIRTPRRLDDPATQLDEYFTGRRNAFELAIDMQLAHGFRRTVLRHLLDVAYGDTVSYAQLAAASGRPAAVRATGSACATNPLPLVVPCHRVVRSDGTIGNYGGGTDAKRSLLALEAQASG